jgi:transposase InsO family protein
MSNSIVRMGVGTRLLYGGELAEVVEMLATKAGNEVVLKSRSGRQILRVAVKELLGDPHVRIVSEEPGQFEESEETASVILSGLSPQGLRQVRERAAHVREVLTGYRSGSPELASSDEPRPEFDPSLPLTSRYEAKAAELGIGQSTLRQWVGDFRRHGEAGLASARGSAQKRTDLRWVEAAREVMMEHSDQSKPSRTMVINRTNSRVAARYGEGSVALPSRATAFRVLEDLERRHPTFRLSTKRNRDIAARPSEAYGKLRPTRPGEYLLLDTTRLDVFALDPVTLRWTQAELTVGMDWYTRCVTGIRVTPVSTKSMDAVAMLYQSYRPPTAGKDWPAHAVWPEHGVPRSVLLDRGALDGHLNASGPGIVPESIVVDHGKIYVSEHMTSVCQRLGISVQPVRLRTGRDKGPVERFFRTLGEDLLQPLPGYKGPDMHSRGVDPEGEAFFYLDELEAIIREWVAVVYHHRPHDSLVDPGVPGLRMSPAAMFEHGVARAGYIEAPRDPDFAYEFLPVEWRTIQHYGVEIGGRRYNGPALDPYRNLTSSHTGAAKGRWPIHVVPDDITRVFFRDPATREWGALAWEHAPSLAMPLSEDALRFARKLAAAKYTYPDDRLAVADLLERWNLGLGSTLVERRIALRLSREQNSLLTAQEPQAREVSALPSVRRVLELAEQVEEPSPPGPDPEPGDDDLEDELDEGDFYADALEDL